MGTLLGEVTAALNEAPFDPDFWSRALESTARACGAASAQLLSFGPCRFSPIVAPGFSTADISAFVALEGADPAINHGLRAVLSSPLHAILTDADYITDRQRARDQLYNEFFRKFDGHYIASGTVARNGAAVCNLNLFLPERTGGLDAKARQTLKRLLPRFTQALRITSRLDSVATALAASAWDAHNDSVMVCDADGAILHASRRAERLLVRYGLPGHWLAGLDAASDAQFRAALKKAVSPVGSESRHCVARLKNGRSLVLDVVPLPRTLSSAIPNVLVLLHEPGRPKELDHARLRSVFHLTPAECAVADGLMRRLSSMEIARMRSVSIETVNTQVKALLAKTNMTDRGKLTLLLQDYTCSHPSE